MWEDQVLLLLNSHTETIDLLTDWFGALGATPIVLTTVNKQALDQLVGPTEAFEIVGTPHDLWKLQDLVEWRLASHAHATRSSAPHRDS
jgi:hypothetical protein